MFLDFEENRPDTPRVPPALTRLERILLSAVAYLLLVVIYLVTPRSVWDPVKAMVTPDEPMRFVQIVSSMPKKMATRPEPARAPTPTPEAAKPEVRPAETPRVDTPAPPADTSPLVAAKVSPDPPPPSLRPPGGILGNALRSLQRDVQSQGFASGPQGNGVDDGPSDAIQFDQKGVDFGPWLRRFKAQVYSNWLIPTAAQVMHGHVVIEMTIHRNGAISDLRILQTSGIESFDSAAMTSLKNSNPTIPIPANYPQDAISPFIVTFYYNEKVR